jgi:hypothetical protein
MPDERERNDDAFGERLGRVLQAREEFSNDFERELVAAIRADAPIEKRLEPRHRTLAASWWVAPKSVRLSPLVALTLAASIATMAVGLTLAAKSGAARDQFNVVRFVFVGDAQSVTLVGDFNAWREDATPLEASSAGRALWTVSVPLPRGRHEYAFIIDGKRWVADPFAPSTSDEFNTASSVITVGS